MDPSTVAGFFRKGNTTEGDLERGDSPRCTMRNDNAARFFAYAK
jgi:hypothetical protein